MSHLAVAAKMIVLKFLLALRKKKLEDILLLLPEKHSVTCLTYVITFNIQNSLLFFSYYKRGNTILCFAVEETDLLTSPSWLRAKWWDCLFSHSNN